MDKVTNADIDVARKFLDGADVPMDNRILWGLEGNESYRQELLTLLKDIEEEQCQSLI